MHRTYSDEEAQKLHFLLEMQEFSLLSFSKPGFVISHDSGTLLIKLSALDLKKLVDTLQENGAIDNTLELVALTDELAKIGTWRSPHSVSWTYATQTNPRDWKKYTSMKLWLHSQGFSIYN